MSNASFKASTVFSKVNLPFAGNGYNQNAVIEYITEYFGDNEYSSVSDLVRDLHMASYESGSLGMCYTHELDDFISGNINDIEEVLEYWMEAMGESLTVQSFSDMVVIALDVAISEIASAIEYADLKIIVNAVDALDPNPEVIICEGIEADEKHAEIIANRLDMEVQHSTTWLNSDELIAMEETIQELVYVVD
jgi:hypothetical protein